VSPQAFAHLMIAACCSGLTVWNYVVYLQWVRLHMEADECESLAIERRQPQLIPCLDRHRREATKQIRLCVGAMALTSVCAVIFSVLFFDAL
jgi:hypothetical protein